ncbi:unnamed protein product [Miscanthus lutarioriparius]|uniref:Uncharacterized protein n=1 Tax=Miscanthus lutarioriparius TaxID=422564 RepID=A0A811PC24_9POAL|nr:unnamed protein product [Miscanthus lutarioriparius]
MGHRCSVPWCRMSSPCCPSPAATAAKDASPAPAPERRHLRALCPAGCGLRSRTTPVLHPQPSALDPPEGVGAEAAVRARGIGQKRRGMESSAGGDGARAQRRRAVVAGPSDGQRGLWQRRGSTDGGGRGAVRTSAAEAQRRRQLPKYSDDGGIRSEGSSEAQRRGEGGDRGDGAQERRARRRAGGSRRHAEQRRAAELLASNRRLRRCRGRAPPSPPPRPPSLTFSAVSAAPSPPSATASGLARLL